MPDPHALKHTGAMRDVACVLVQENNRFMFPKSIYFEELIESGIIEEFGAGRHVVCYEKDHANLAK